MKDLPTQLATELAGHQGPVRAVRFNSKRIVILWIMYHIDTIDIIVSVFGTENLLCIPFGTDINIYDACLQIYSSMIYRLKQNELLYSSIKKFLC